MNSSQLNNTFSNSNQSYDLNTRLKLGFPGPWMLVSRVMPCR
nr:hypothetical protein Iba_chr15aCG15940 [Ipomoea batatas]GME14469.1 hypothetical protein Iba_scaffold15229CG0010 [Ipomoea batatas]